jgi:D-serine deaminase-like pyridoxal phosphate-dependent protein
MVSRAETETPTVHAPAELGLRPDVLATLPTPCLVADRAAIDRNLAEARRQANGVPLRPHLKAHKCSRLLREQLAAGPCAGATCATAHEAEVAVAAGVRDVLVANEVVDAEPLAAIADLAGRVTVTAAVDSPVGLERLEACARAAGSRVGVLIDLDVGQHRCGVDPGDPQVLELARRAAASDAVELRGLMGYEGHAQHEPEADARERLAREVAAELTQGQARLREAGLDCAFLSGGGTGTLAAHGRLGALTEVQAGSYVLMDQQYLELGLPFQPAVWCLATVVSRRGADAVVNAGWKELAGEDGPPAILVAGAAVGELSDEHANVRLAAGTGLAVGDRVLLAPRHLDPTLNLHARLHVCGPDGGVEAWPVDARV